MLQGIPNLKNSTILQAAVSAIKDTSQFVWYHRNRRTNAFTSEWSNNSSQPNAQFEVISQSSAIHLFNALAKVELKYAYLSHAV